MIMLAFPVAPDGRDREYPQVEPQTSKFEVLQCKMLHDVTCKYSYSKWFASSRNLQAIMQATFSDGACFLHDVRRNPLGTEACFAGLLALLVVCVFFAESQFARVTLFYNWHSRHGQLTK